MSSLVTTFALLFASAGLVTSAYMIPAPGAAAVPAGVSDKAVVQPTSPLRPAYAMSTTRPPVPLLVSRRNTYFVADPQQEKPTTVEAVVARLPEQAAPSDAAAKTMIEADGYKKVTGLAKGPDGKWHGRALRGATEVAVSVDDSGSVAAD